MMSAACCGERHESGIVSVRSAELVFRSARFIAGTNMVAMAIQIVITSAAPLSITTTRPMRRRCAVRTDDSARVIGLLTGERLLSTFAALYSLARSSVVSRERAQQPFAGEQSDHPV